MFQRVRWSPPGYFRNYLPVLLLLWLFGVLLVGARCLSLTVDEPAHIAAGYAFLARGKAAFWMLPQEGPPPPLLTSLEASLLHIYQTDIPLERLDGWASHFGNFVCAFMPHLMPVERTEVIARMPIILLTLLLGVLVFRWGKHLWGLSAGLISLGVLCFDPLLIAHGRLATSDVGVVAFGTTALYITWRWIESPSWGKALAMGTLLGLAMLAKGNGLLWAGGAGLMIFWKLIRRSGRFRLWLAQGVVAGAVSFLVLWSGCAFTWGPVGNLPGTYPAPDYWNGLISQALSVEKRWVFALGVHKYGKWWWYFPLAFLIKNPLPLLLALGVSGAVLLRCSISPSRLVALGLFPTLYIVMAMTSGMNIGYRHMLPIHPFVYLAIGRGMSTWISSISGYRWKRIATAVLGAWYIAGTIRMFPYEIAYFNELVGGPRNGHYYLVDSNIDWGQGYKALRRYLEEHPGPTPKVAYSFLSLVPAYYDILYEPLPPGTSAPPESPFHPPPGRYVISITALQRGWPESPDMYAWFRQIQPTAEIGYSFFVYDVDPPPLDWIAQCLIPASPLSDEAIRFAFGQQGLRRVDFDCTTGWIYPAGGTKLGVYSFHHALVEHREYLFPPFATPEPRDRFIARHLEEARLSAEVNWYTSEFPAFVLYEQEKPPSVPFQSAGARPAVESLVTFEGADIEPPIPLNGPLSFLGVNTRWEGTLLDVETWWMVTEGPVIRPFSIMGHLMATDGAVLGVSDGLAVSPVELLPGDILVQRHRFGEVTGSEFILRTGVYWLDTMERWPVANMPGADTLLVRLETLQ